MKAISTSESAIARPALLRDYEKRRHSGGGIALKGVLYEAIMRLHRYSQAIHNDFSEDRLHRSRLPDAKLRNVWKRFLGAPDGRPIPPSRLVFAVAGTPNVAWFLYSGKLA